MSVATGKTLRRLLGQRLNTRIIDGMDFSIVAGTTNVSEITITPKYGYGAGAAIDEAKRVQDKQIEDQVNPLGMKMLLDASYSPCGYQKIQYVMEKNSAVSSALTYLYTHPGIDDRVKLSKQYL